MISPRDQSGCLSLDTPVDKGRGTRENSWDQGSGLLLLSPKAMWYRTTQSENELNLVPGNVAIKSPKLQICTATAPTRQTKGCALEALVQRTETKDQIPAPEGPAGRCTA